MIKVFLLLVFGLAVAVMATPILKRDDIFAKKRDDIFADKRDDIIVYKRDDKFAKRDDIFAKRDDNFGDKRDDIFAKKRDDIFAKRDDIFAKRDDNFGDKRDDIFAKRDDIFAKRDDIIVYKRDDIFADKRDDIFAKRDDIFLPDKRDDIFAKRTISFVQTEPQVAPAPGSTTIYYYVQNPDGTVSLLSTGGQPQVQQPIVVQQPQTSSGLLGPVVSKPLGAVGNIVGTVADTANTVLALPFKVVDQAIQGVGLSDTGVGQVAQGVLDVGEKVIQAPLNLVSGLVQAPLKLLGKK